MHRKNDLAIDCNLSIDLPRPYQDNRKAGGESPEQPNL
jgi:hypothetical protein